MIPLIVRYRWFFITRTLTRYIPEKWTELRPAARIKLYNVILKSKPEQIGSKALIHLLNLPKRLLALIPQSSIDKLLAKTAWARIEPDSSPVFPSFKYRMQSYYLPTEKFKNGKAMEYAIADGFYSKYIQTGDAQHLNKLIATLARTETIGSWIKRKSKMARPSDLRRELLSLDQVDSYALWLKKLPEHHRTAVFLYFAGVKAYVAKVYGRYIFEGGDEDNQDDDQNDPDDDEQVHQEKEKSSGPGFGWFGTFMDVAKQGVFGKYKDVLQVSFHTLCVWLVKQKQASDELESRMKSYKTHE